VVADLKEVRTAIGKKIGEGFRLDDSLILRRGSKKFGLLLFQNKNVWVEDDDQLKSYLQITEEHDGKYTSVAGSWVGGMAHWHMTSVSVFGLTERTEATTPLLTDVNSDGYPEIVLSVDYLGSDPSRHSIRILSLRRDHLVDTTPTLPEGVVPKFLADVEGDGTMELFCLDHRYEGFGEACTQCPPAPAYIRRWDKASQQWFFDPRRDTVAYRKLRRSVEQSLAKWRDPHGGLYNDALGSLLELAVYVELEGESADALASLEKEMGLLPPIREGVRGDDQDVKDFRTNPRSFARHIIETANPGR
jgi:hypothetical protein